MWRVVDERFFFRALISLVTALFLQRNHVASVVMPSSRCYAFDNSSHIYDFSSWIGHPFEYDGKDVDLVVRFCKDVETRSQTGYVDFGRFDFLNYFVPGPEPVNFIQGVYNGDLANCENSYDKMGRTAQVNIICGSCLNGQCKGLLGCICNVTYESSCRVLIELAIPCEKQGLRVFEGFTVGFHPRSWEVVYTGMTQSGFEMARPGFSFGTEQTHVALYMTAIASQYKLVQKPILKIFPENGLDVKLSGSGVQGSHLPLYHRQYYLWIGHAREIPDEVDITIPIEGYEPIQFTLTKTCEYGQGNGGDATKGWAIFGVFSCVFIVLSTVLCCGGFIYNTRVQHQRGLDALPGMSIVSACLETVSGGAVQNYSRAEDVNSAFGNQASWGRPFVSAQGGSQTTDKIWVHLKLIEVLTNFDSDPYMGEYIWFILKFMEPEFLNL